MGSRFPRNFCRLLCSSSTYSSRSPELVRKAGFSRSTINATMSGPL